MEHTRYLCLMRIKYQALRRYYSCQQRYLQKQRLPVQARWGFRLVKSSSIVKKFLRLLKQINLLDKGNGYSKNHGIYLVATILQSSANVTSVPNQPGPDLWAKLHQSFLLE